METAHHHVDMESGIGIRISQELDVTVDHIDLALTTDPISLKR
jgi:hypothetical protein